VRMGNWQDMYQFIIQAELEEVTTMKLQVFEPPEIDFRVVQSPGKRGFWQCGYCGQTNDFEKDLCCRFCGGRR